MTTEENLPRRTWFDKFRDAFRGMAVGIRGERSFAVHLPAAVAVIASGFALRVSRAEWGLLIFSITGVMVAEMFNSAMECMAQAIDREHNPRLGRALDISSAAVLTAAIGAVAVGTLVFLPRLTAIFRGCLGA